MCAAVRFWFVVMQVPAISTCPRFEHAWLCPFGGEAVSECATDKSTANVQPDLKFRLASVRNRCAVLRGRKPAEEEGAWPRDLNATDRDGLWGSDPAEVRDE